MPALGQRSVLDLFAVPLAPWWMADALCAEYPDAVFFPERGDKTDEAKALCARCLVRSECLEYALAFEAATKGGRHGVWGGTSAAERAALARVRSAMTPKTSIPNFLVVATSRASAKPA